MSSVYPLYGLAQHYGWGGNRFIPSLIQLDNQAQHPFAEWWLGAHEDAPSVIMTPTGPQPLHYSIAHDPAGFLGQPVLQRHGRRLPFLLKVLDVASPLSIQVHPDAAQAHQGFVRENSAGIPLSDPQRNYKDPFPKPEMMVALSTFWLLHGFRTAAAIAESLAGQPEWQPLRERLAKNGTGPLYQHLMCLPQAEIDRLLLPVIDRLAGQVSSMDSPDYWFSLSATSRGADRGLFGFYLLNLVCLRPGEAIFQPARLPHAYLHGRNIELMANSDNVLRGGLTDKHIAITELLNIVDCGAVQPNILQPADSMAGLQAYPRCGGDYFALDQLFLSDGDSISLQTMGPEVLLLVDGSMQLQHAGTSSLLTQGMSVYLQPGLSCRLQAQHLGLAWRAHCPTHD